MKQSDLIRIITGNGVAAQNIALFKDFFVVSNVYVQYADDRFQRRQTFNSGNVQPTESVGKP